MGHSAGKLPPLPPLPRIRRAGNTASSKGARLIAPTTLDPGRWEVGDDGQVRGVCGKCGELRPAICLIRMPDKVVFGQPVLGKWVCSDCNPGQFGRVNGKPTKGWESPEG